MSLGAPTMFGNPSFTAADTFLGKKVTQSLEASLPWTDAKAAEELLGRADSARYGEALDRLRAGSIPVLSGYEPDDVRARVAGIVDPQVKKGLDNIPKDLANQERTLASLQKMGVFDPNNKNLWADYYSPQEVAEIAASLSKHVKTDPIPAAWKPPTQTGSDVLTVAQSFVGPTKYTYGTWDCSAFTQAVAKGVGISIPRSTGGQAPWFQQRKLWSSKIADASPGDLVYFYSGASPSGRHVGVYIGGGLMIDNAGRGKPIAVRSVAGRRVMGVGMLSRLAGSGPVVPFVSTGSSTSRSTSSPARTTSATASRQVIR